MAWNESFSTEGGGGWMQGETSFATSGPVKDSSTSRTGERLAPPVTINDLCNQKSPDEKYVLGNYAFSAVCTMGIVRSYQLTDSMVTYVLCDPEDEFQEYSVVSYFGTGSDGGEPVVVNPYVEGSRIEATGRLRNLNNDYGIMVYTLREVTNDKEYEAFQLEAKISKIFFTNDIYHQLQSGQGEKLTGLCIGAPAASTNPSGGGATRIDTASNYSTQQARIYNNTPAPAAQTSGLAGQKGRILDILKENRDDYGENGMSIDDIKIKLGTMNVNQVRTDLEYLVGEGHAYNTINEDNYAFIG